MTRLFHPFALNKDANASLTNANVRHLSVLRHKIGDNITLFNGDGCEYLAKIVQLTKKEAVVEIVSASDISRELPFDITLAQALPEGNKIDFIIEKAVELGVKNLIPIQAKRSVVKLQGERLEKKLERWNSIVIAASEQCGRNTLMRISPTVSLEDFFSSNTDKNTLLLTPQASQPLGQWLKQNTPSPTTLLIGPEGGFDDDEIALAIQKGAKALTFGKRILRTETAGVAILGAINAAWDLAL